jgi:hypothetical protein
VPLSIVRSAVMWVMHAVLRVCALIPPLFLTSLQGFMMPIRMSRLKTGQNLGWRGCGPHHGELHGSPLSTGLRVARDRDRDLGPMLKRALRLLCGGDGEDVL